MTRNVFTDQAIGPWRTVGCKNIILDKKKYICVCSDLAQGSSYLNVARQLGAMSRLNLLFFAYLNDQNSDFLKCMQN